MGADGGVRRPSTRPSAGFWALPAPAVLAILGPTCGAASGLLVLPLITLIASARTGNAPDTYADIVQLSLWFAIIEVAVGFLAGGFATAVGLLVRWPFTRWGTVARVLAVSLGAGAAAYLAGYLIETAFQGYFGPALGAGVLSAFIAGSVLALLEWACAAGRARSARRTAAWDDAHTPEPVPTRA